MFFYPSNGHDLSSTAHKVLLASGVASYTSDVTFRYHRRRFVGESPTWAWCPHLLRNSRRFDGSRGRCRGGGAGAVRAAAAADGSKGWFQGGGAKTVRAAAAAATAAAEVDGSSAGAVEPEQYAQPRQQQRPSPSVGAGGDAGVVEPEQQQQRPPQSIGAGGSAEGTAARILVIEQWIPAADRAHGDGAIFTEGPRAEPVAATFTTGPQEHAGIFAPMDTFIRRDQGRWCYPRRGGWSRTGGGDVQDGATGTRTGANIFPGTATQERYRMTPGLRG